VPIALRVRIGVAMLSYAGEVTFGITADVLRAVGSHGKALGGRLGYGLAAMGALLRHGLMD